LDLCLTLWAVAGGRYADRFVIIVIPLYDSYAVILERDGVGGFGIVVTVIRSYAFHRGSLSSDLAASP